MDEWGLDVVVAGSQKALMARPGFRPPPSRPRRGSRSRPQSLPSFYLDWERTRRAQAARLRVHAGRLARRRAGRGARLAARGRARGCLRAPRPALDVPGGIKAMGLELFSLTKTAPPSLPPPACLRGSAPELTLALRERHGVTIAADRASSRTRSSGSATSGGTTSSTSRQPSPRSRSCSASWERRSSGASLRRAPEAYAQGAPV